MKDRQCNMVRTPNSIEGSDAKPARPYNSSPTQPSVEAPATGPKLGGK